jgi:cobalamin-dependent methionine synthase I
MDKKLAVSLIVAAFLVGAVGAGVTVGYSYNRMALRLVCLSETAKAGMDVGVLNQLQANNITNAIRLLDTELDGSLVTLWFFRDDIRPSDRDITLGTLRKAKEYRAKFPHQGDSSTIDETVSNAFSLVDAPVVK